MENQLPAIQQNLPNDEILPSGGNEAAGYQI